MTRTGLQTARCRWRGAGPNDEGLAAVNVLLRSEAADLMPTEAAILDGWFATGGGETCDRK